MDGWIDEWMMASRMDGWWMDEDPEKTLPTADPKLVLANSTYSRLAQSRSTLMCLWNTSLLEGLQACVDFSEVSNSSDVKVGLRELVTDNNSAPAVQTFSLLPAASDMPRVLRMALHPHNVL